LRSVGGDVPVKINLDGLYDLLGSADARRQFEDSIIQKLREKLDWLKLRVDHYNVVNEWFRKKQSQLFESGYNKTILEIDDIILDFDDFSDYNKAEWTAIIAILQTLVGEDPGDNNPFDIEAITKVLVEYRRCAKLVEWQEAADGINSDGKSQTALRSAAPGLNDAIEWGIREIGHPAHDVDWKTFCDKVWKRCGVKPEAKGYSSRTIRRLVARRST
jgi:hypothetical protein